MLGFAFSRKCYTLQELTSDNPPDGVDLSKLETYLSDEEFEVRITTTRHNTPYHTTPHALRHTKLFTTFEFQKIFEMGRDLYDKLPAWKQDILKKAFALF